MNILLTNTPNGPTALERFDDIKLSQAEPAPEEIAKIDKYLEEKGKTIISGILPDLYDESIQMIELRLVLDPTAISEPQKLVTPFLNIQIQAIQQGARKPTALMVGLSTISILALILGGTSDFVCTPWQQ